jgi:hypothetical protein
MTTSTMTHCFLFFPVKPKIKMDLIWIIALSLVGLFIVIVLYIVYQKKSNESNNNRNSLRVSYRRTIVSSTNTWFSQITGTSERDWNNQFKQNKDGTMSIINKITMQEYNAGKQVYTSIGDLKRIVDLQGTLHEFQYHKGSEIYEILNNSENANHMFQVPCRFNGLHYATNVTSCKDTQFFQRYAYNSKDKGCMMSLTVPAAAISRRLNHSSKQFNLLESLHDIFSVHEGKVWRIEPLESNDDNQQINQIKVLYNQNAMVYYDVTLLPSTNQGRMINNPFPIHQVCTATLNTQEVWDIFKEQNMLDQVTSHQVDTIVKFLVEAAYTSAYLAARACQAKDLWLSLISDDIDMTQEVLHKVHKMYGRRLNVHLVE